MRLAALLAVALLAACGRPDIDPAPYDTDCTQAPCPSDYDCVHPEGLASPPEARRCYAPCDHDGDCPDGFLCNGDTSNVADLGPPVGYCYRSDDV
jgi:hypothetical protein